NVRGAFLHMAADAGVSLGVVVAGLVMARMGWSWLDPALSLAIGAVIVWGTWSLLLEAFRLAIDAVPEGVAYPAVEAYLRCLAGLPAARDPHIWGASPPETALTAHRVKPDVGGDAPLLEWTRRELHDRFGIEHVTIQLERENGRCSQERASAV